MAKKRDSGSFFGNAFSVFKQTVNECLQEKAPQLGAALAYYTVFSVAPRTENVLIRQRGNV